MRRKASTLAAVAAVALGVAWLARALVSPRVTPVKVGDAAPDFALPHYNQPTARGTLAQLRGSPVLLVLFDSSWPGTPVYLTELEKMHRRFLREGLAVVGVALDPAVEKPALEFMLFNRGVTYTVLLDPESAATGPLYGRPRGLPETYVIDAAGRVRAIHHDPRRWTTPQALSDLQALLPAPTPTPLDRPRTSG